MSDDLRALACEIVDIVHEEMDPIVGNNQALTKIIERLRAAVEAETKRCAEIITSHAAGAQALLDAAVEAEREGCAAIADRYDVFKRDDGAMSTAASRLTKRGIAAAIRARKP